MKFFFSLIGVIVLTFSVSAQKLDVGINFTAGFPVGDYNFGDEFDSFSLPPGTGLGGTIEANYWFNESFSAGIEIGYVGFAMQEHSVQIEDDSPVDPTVESKSSAIPLLLKGTYTFNTGALKPYVSVGLGYFIYDPMITIVTPAFLILPEQRSEVTWEQSGFMVSPRLGCVYTLSDLLALNLNAQYNLVLNELDGNVEITQDGQKDTIENAVISATNYFAVNLGVIITLFE